VNFRQLRTFVLIADAGGLARAADRLHLSQPAASRQIQALEAEFGVPLFDRIGRRIQLTSEGEDLLRRCRRLLQDADSIGERARALKGGQTGILRVGATPQVIEGTLAPFLTEHRKRHPGVEVHLVEAGGASLSTRLDRGDVHVALIALDRRHARFENRPLYWAWGLAILPERHALARQRTLELAQLADERLMLLDRTFISREWFDTGCTIAHIHPRVLMESGAPQTIVALAATGYGIAIVPSTVRFSREGVRAVPLVQRGAPFGRWLTAAWDPQRSLALYAKNFIDELVIHCRRDHPGREFAKRAPIPRPVQSANS
jgi:DNA-binding transcriptional LysR family regulator